MDGVINSVIKWVADAINSILNLLPNSPFSYVYGLDTQWLNVINYFLPVKEFVGVLETYVVAVLLYYVIRVPARWAKLAGE